MNYLKNSVNNLEEKIYNFNTINNIKTNFDIVN